jgi:hypothetical protein
MTATAEQMRQAHNNWLEVCALTPEERQRLFDTLSREGLLMLLGVALRQAGVDV